MRRRRGDQPLSKLEILRAALSIVDELGLAALTMRRLGDALQVEAMSIYGHVRNKDQLLLDVVDFALSDVDVTAGDEPIQSAIDLAYSYRATLLRHPNLLPLLARREVTPPLGAHERRDAAIALARTAGLDEDWAVTAYMTIISFVAGHVLTHVGLLNAGEELEGPHHPDELFRVGLELIVEVLLARAGVTAYS